MTGPLYPSNYSKIWIRGRFITMDGQAVQGKLSFFPTVTGGALVDRAAKLIMSAAAFSADTDADGYVALQVPATNDPDITPVNFSYSVTTPIGQKFSITVPYDTTPLNSVGDPLHGQPVIELIDMVPVGSSGGVGQLLRGIGVQSMVDNGAGGLLITYTDGSTSTVTMPGTVAGPPGPPGPQGPAGYTDTAAREATGTSATASVTDHGADGTARRVLDAAITSGQTALTSASAAFGAGDVGRYIIVWGAGPSGGTLITTIAARVSATQVTLDNAAATTVSGAVAITGADATAAFTAARAALPASGGVVRIPAGRYLLLGSVTQSGQRVRWEGDGGGARPDSAQTTGTLVAGQPLNATHVWSAVTGAPAFTGDGHGSAFVGWCLQSAIKDPPPGTPGLLVTKGYYNRYTDLTIAGFRVDLDIEDGSEWRAERCTIFDPVDVGLRMANATHGDEGDMTLHACSFVARDREANAAIRWTSAGGLMMTDCKVNNDFQSDGSKDVYWRRIIDAPITQWTSNCLIENNSFENYTEWAIRIEVLSGQTFGNVKITGNEFLAWKTAGREEPRAVHIIGNRGAGSPVNGVSVDNNICNSGGGSAHPAIELVDCDNVSVGAGNVLTGYNRLVSMTGCQKVTPTHLVGSALPDIADLSRWVRPDGQQIIANEVVTLDRCFYVPISLSAPYYPIEAASGVVSGLTGTTAHLALYRDDGHGRPAGSPVAVTASLDGVGDYHLASGALTLASGEVGQPGGLYHLAVVFHGSSAPTVSMARPAAQTAFTSVFAAELVFDDRTCWSQDGVTGAPGTVGTLNSRSTAPASALRLS